MSLALAACAFGASAQETKPQKEPRGFWATLTEDPRDLEEALGIHWTVAPYAKGTKITHQPPSIWSGTALMDSLMLDIHRAVAWMRKTGKWAEGDALLMEVYTPMQDKYGNKSPGLFIALRFPMGELRKVNTDNVLGWGLMNFANIAELPQPAYKHVAEWCAADRNAQYANRFCTHATGYMTARR